VGEEKEGMSGFFFYSIPDIIPTPHLLIVITRNRLSFLTYGHPTTCQSARPRLWLCELGFVQYSVTTVQQLLTLVAKHQL